MKPSVVALSLPPAAAPIAPPPSAGCVWVMPAGEGTRRFCGDPAGASGLCVGHDAMSVDTSDLGIAAICVDASCAVFGVRRSLVEAGENFRSGGRTAVQTALSVRRVAMTVMVAGVGISRLRVAVAFDRKLAAVGQAAQAIETLRDHADFDRMVERVEVAVRAILRLAPGQSWGGR